ncbi:MAG: bile acid:sodium symporter family protein [Halobacteria archaeon]
MAEPGFVTSQFSDFLVPAGLAVVMFGLGLGLTGADFRRVPRAPRAVALGLAAQVVALPLLAVGVALLFHRGLGLGPVLVQGLLLVACCPSGAVTNFFTYLARGDLALSVTLNGVVSVASAVTTPIAFVATSVLVLGSAPEVAVSFTGVAGVVLALIVAPMLLGMLLRNRRPGLALRAEKPFRLGAMAFLAFIVAGVIYANRENFAQLILLSGAAVLALNILAFGSGFLLARLARLGEPETRAISMEVGFQNGGLGIALALGQMQSPPMAVVPGVYSLLMFFVGGIAAWLWARRPLPAGGPGDLRAAESTTTSSKK